MQDGGSNNLVLSQTLTAPGGSNNTDFGRKVGDQQPSFVSLQWPLQGAESASRSIQVQSHHNWMQAQIRWPDAPKMSSLPCAPMPHAFEHSCR